MFLIIVLANFIKIILNLNLTLFGLILLSFVFIYFRIRDSYLLNIVLRWDIRATM